MGMLEDLLSGNLSSNSVNADSLQIDAINIAYKKMELKFTKVTATNAIFIQAVTNLLIEKGIFTKEEFANAIIKENEKGNIDKTIEPLEKHIKEMEEKFAKDSAELLKQNAEMMEFYDLLMGKNKKEEKKEDKKDGE